MFAPNPRQSDILEFARLRGRVDVSHLAARFKVTPQTIRRDLNALCDNGLLTRTHGGAVRLAGSSNPEYEVRRNLAAAAKARIGLAAAQLIAQDSSVIINLGTTTEQVALALVHHEGLTVVTNNVNVAEILRKSPGIEVIIAGGLVRSSDGGIVGEATVEFIRQFKVEYAIIGASGVDQDGAILDYDYREVRVAREIIGQARKTILVVDSRKFSMRPPVRIAHLSMIDILVTEIRPPDPILKICRDHDVDVVIADDQLSHFT